MTSWNNALNVRNPIYKLYDYKKNNGTIERLSVSNLQLYKEVAGVPTAITGTLTTNAVKMITYKDRSINDVTIIADGGRLKVYNGTNVSQVTPHIPTTGTGGEETDPGLNDLANLTNCRCLALKKDRLFLVGHPTQKNRVHFSWIDPIIGYAVYDYIPAIYFFDVAVEDNDEIVELKVFRNLLIIFCKKSIWALKGDGNTLADLELIKINVPNGCVAPESVQAVGNNLFYLGDDHIYSLFASEQEFVSAQVVSDNIKPILKSIDITSKAKATSIFYDNKYFLSFSNGVTLVYDVTLSSWTKYTNIKANSFVVRDDVLYFSTDSGQIYRFNENIFNDDGDPINFMMKTKILDLGLPVNKKKFRRVWVLSKQFPNYNSSYDLDIFIDQYLMENFKGLQGEVKIGSSGTWDDSLWDDVTWDFSESTQREIKVKEKGKDIQFQVINNVLNEPFSIFGLVTEFQIKKA